MLLFRTEPDSLSAESMSEDEDTQNNSNPAIEDVEDLMSKCPPLL